MPRFFSSPIALIIVLALAAVSGAKLWGSWESYREFKDGEARLLERQRYLEGENQRVRQELRLSHTAEAIERDGKSRLNLKKEGEEVVVVVPSEHAPTLPSRNQDPWSHFRELIASLLSFFD